MELDTIIDKAQKITLLLAEEASVDGNVKPEIIIPMVQYVAAAVLQSSMKDPLDPIAIGNVMNGFSSRLYNIMLSASLSRSEAANENEGKENGPG